MNKITPRIPRPAPEVRTAEPETETLAAVAQAHPWSQDMAGASFDSRAAQVPACAEVLPEGV